MDKLQFTVPVFTSARNDILSDLGNLSQTGELNLHRVPNYPYLRHYRVGCHLLLNGQTGAECTVHAGPFHARNNFLRLAFNPSAAGSEGYAAVRTFLDFMSEIAQTPLDTARARITRVDLAVDITDVRPDELFVSVNGPRRSVAYYAGDGRTAQTMYFGEEDMQYIVYDKTAEREARAGIEAEQQLTRMEVRYGRGLRVYQLGRAANKFRNIEIEECTLAEEAATTDRRRIQFIDSCYHRGKQAALDLYSSNRNQRAWLQVTVQTPYGKNSTLRDIPRFLCQDPVQR